LSDRTHFGCDSVARLKDITGTFDLILDIGCYQGLSHVDRTAYQNHIRRLLSKNGVFMLYGMISQKEGEFGLTSRDLHSFGKDLPLIRQTNGTDRSRVSTWLWFQRFGLPDK
jgi:cyclopropane fatty-acyl-phospholipid synthase-like methyltransferase